MSNYIADQFYDVQRQMQAEVNKRQQLQQKVGQKLVHVKLKGHEDVADSFKRLIKLKSHGSYYAVKEAQLRPLIETDSVRPSKNVQKRIEGTEREIFNLLSSENSNPNAPKIPVFNLSNCLTILKDRRNELKSKLAELAFDEAELGEKDFYTEDGFLKRDVETREDLQRDKEVMETKAADLEKAVQQSTAALQEAQMKRDEAEANLKNLQSFSAAKQSEIEALQAALAEARAKSSAQRDARNRALYRATLQRRALGKMGDGEIRIKAAESLTAQKKDIEQEISDKSEQLELLKIREKDLDAEDTNLDTIGNNLNNSLKQLKQDSEEIDNKINGTQESNIRKSRDLETCLEDVASDMDPTCTVWRDRALKTIFDVGVLDVNMIKNIAFSNPEKYKYPTEQYTLIQSIKPELGMIQGGLCHLKSKIDDARDQIDSLHERSRCAARHRDDHQHHLAEGQETTGRHAARLARLEELLRAAGEATAGQVERLVEVLPATAILDGIEPVRKNELLGAEALKRIAVARGEYSEVLEEYNGMKRKILEGSEGVTEAQAFAFLQKDEEMQTKLERRLKKQLAELFRMKNGKKDYLFNKIFKCGITN